MYAQWMMTKKKNSSRAVNVGAFQILEAITHSPRLITLKPKAAKKNPAAVALGRLGGRKGGKTRAKKLSKGQRQTIAHKAAKAPARERGVGKGTSNRWPGFPPVSSKRPRL
jgi:hypothetical protein